MIHLWTFSIDSTEHADFCFSLYQGAVGLAIWVPSVANQNKDSEPSSDTRNLSRGYSSLVATEDKDEGSWRRRNNGGDRELSIIETSVYSEAVNEETILEDIKVSRLFLFP